MEDERERKEEEEVRWLNVFMERRAGWELIWGRPCFSRNNGMELDVPPTPNRLPPFAGCATAHLVPLQLISAQQDSSPNELEHGLLSFPPVSVHQFIRINPPFPYFLAASNVRANTLLLWHLRRPSGVQEAMGSPPVSHVLPPGTLR